MEWKSKTLRSLGKLRSAGVNKLIDSNQKEVNLVNYMDVYKNHQISFEISFQRVTAKDSEIKNASLLKGDILFTPSSEKPTDIGHAGVIMEDLENTVYSYHLVRFRLLEPKLFDEKFLSYLLNTYDAEKHFVTRATGTTRYTLSLSDFYSLKIKYPSSKPEQTAIATILSKVDQTIEATTQSIKAAEKLKKALMQNLLSGRLKPDGTWRGEDEFYEDEKFGKVPKGWVVKSIGDKSIAKINPNYKFSKNETYDFIPMDGINDCFRGVKYIEKKKIDNAGYTRFKKGDILFAKITPCTENGKVTLISEMSTEVGFASTEFIVFSPSENIDNKFYYYLLSSSKVHKLAVSLMEGTTGRQRVPWKVFKNRILGVFPKSKNDQKAIVSKLECFENQVKNNEIKIQTLEKLKKSLMQNFLSGKKRLSKETIEHINQTF